MTAREIVPDSELAMEVALTVACSVPSMIPTAQGVDHVVFSPNHPIMVWKVDESPPAHHPIELYTVQRKTGARFKLVCTEEAADGALAVIG